MKRNHITKFLLAACCLTGFLGTPAIGIAGMDEQRLHILVAENRISAKQAAKRAQRKSGGRVLSVDLKRADSDNPYYAVKVIKDGKVSIVKIPAN